MCLNCKLHAKHGAGSRLLPVRASSLTSPGCEAMGKSSKRRSLMPWSTAAAFCTDRQSAEAQMLCYCHRVLQTLFCAQPEQRHAKRAAYPVRVH